MSAPASARDDRRTDAAIRSRTEIRAEPRRRIDSDRRGGLRHCQLQRRRIHLVRTVVRDGRREMRGRSGNERLRVEYDGAIRLSRDVRCQSQTVLRCSPRGRRDLDRQRRVGSERRIDVILDREIRFAIVGEESTVTGDDSTRAHRRRVAGETTVLRHTDECETGRRLEGGSDAMTLSCPAAPPNRVAGNRRTTRGRRPPSTTARADSRVPNAAPACGRSSCRRFRR